MCVSLAVSHGSSELILNSPRILKSSQRQKSRVPLMSPAFNQCLQRIGFKILTLRARAEMPSPTLLRCGGQFTLSQKAAGTSIILLQFHEQSSGVKALSWLKVESISSCDALTWHACSGTTPGSWTQGAGWAQTGAGTGRCWGTWSGGRRAPAAEGGPSTPQFKKK